MISCKILIINMLYLLADAEGESTSENQLNSNVYKGLSGSLEAILSFRRLAGDSKSLHGEI